VYVQDNGTLDALLCVDDDDDRVSAELRTITIMVLAGSHT
jgi:hypothetical protein